MEPCVPYRTSGRDRAGSSVTPTLPRRTWAGRSAIGPAASRFPAPRRDGELSQTAQPCFSAVYRLINASPVSRSTCRSYQASRRQRGFVSRLTWEACRGLRNETEDEAAAGYSVAVRTSLAWLDYRLHGIGFPEGGGESSADKALSMDGRGPRIRTPAVGELERAGGPVCRAQ